jgi:hypothetical protein
VASVLALAVVATSLVSMKNAASDSLGPPPDSRAIDQLGGRVASTLRALHAPVIVTSTVPSSVFSNISGRSELTLALVRRGVPVVVNDNLDDRVRYGDWRARPATASADVILVAAPSGYQPPAGSRLLAVVDPLTASQRALRTRAAALPHEPLATLRRRIQHDPELRALVEQLAKIPDFPPLAVLLTPRR